MKTKKQPLINEIFLGRSVEEFVEDHFPDLSPFDDEGNGDPGELVEEIVGELFRINDPNVRFVAFETSEGSFVTILNAQSCAQVNFDRYEDDEDDPNQILRSRKTAKILNDFVERFFGTKRKKQKAKIAQKDFVEKKGKVCPFCMAEPEALGPARGVYGEPGKRTQNMGCPKCGEIWSRETKVKTVEKTLGFSDFL